MKFGFHDYVAEWILHYTRFIGDILTSDRYIKQNDEPTRFDDGRKMCGLFLEKESVVENEVKKKRRLAVSAVSLYLVLLEEITTAGHVRYRTRNIFGFQLALKDIR
ncbi:hypothetical protein Tco_1542830 [Tanacetum coccineum]